jgi:hypothetical protein
VSGGPLPLASLNLRAHIYGLRNSDQINYLPKQTKRPRRKQATMNDSNIPSPAVSLPLPVYAPAQPAPAPNNSRRVVRNGAEGTRVKIRGFDFPDERTRSRSKCKIFMSLLVMCSAAAGFYGATRIIVIRQVPDPDSETGFRWEDDIGADAGLGLVGVASSAIFIAGLVCLTRSCRGRLS